MANFTTIIPNETIQEYLAGTRSTITAAIGTPAGCSLVLTNKSPIEYTISQNGQIIETVEPYTIVTMSTTQNMQVTADAASSVAQALTLPSYRVSYTTSGQMVSATAKTSIQFPGSLPVTGNVTVNNFPATIQVKTAEGDTVVVAGEVAITVPAGTNIGIDGVATVEFNGTQEVSANITNATLDSNIINARIAANTLVLLDTFTVDITNLAPGDTASTGNPANIDTIGLYDGVVVLINSPNYNGRYDFAFYQVFISEPVGYTNIDTNLPETLPFAFNGNSMGYLLWSFGEAVAFNALSAGLLNNSTDGTTLVSDTVTLWYYGIRATETINNTSDNPANVLQPATAYNPVVNGSIATGGTSQQMVGSNATRKFLRVWNTSATDILWFQFGQASGVHNGYPIGPGFGDTLEVPQPSNSVWVYGATAGDTYAYLEG